MDKHNFFAYLNIVWYKFMQKVKHKGHTALTLVSDPHCLQCSVSNISSGTVFLINMDGSIQPFPDFGGVVI